MNEFGFYLKQGIDHITDLKGIDHMLFIITLCAVYRFDQWKRILILVTAFTVGHTVTLALSSLDVIRINQTLVETLIPVTILLTSVFNILQPEERAGKVSLNYLLALCFGLIHGMGFSNFFRAMMMGIADGAITVPLFGFNLGIEVGQLMIVTVFLSLLVLFTKVFKVKHREWNLYISGAGGGLAVKMIIDALL
jgi:hypothetical protein